ncbi:MAG: pyridoxamine 5'-phosphate oxidase, partial [Cyanobacteriota bacterium]|nr:pyridoxamine 5'-phosphate oxidase [Cyanobacteriota bacterium]
GLADHWQKLSPPGRSVWAWPNPGELLSEAGPWPREVVDGEAVPPHLLLLRIHLSQVEQLDLKPHPHCRRRWQRHDHWCEQRLNP